MRIIKKFKANDRIVPIRSLSHEEIEALFWVFIKNKGTLQQEEIVKTLSEFARDRHCWFECNCEVEEDTHALMTIGLSHKNNYYLQHVNSRGGHHESCCFRGEPGATGTSSDAVKRIRKAGVLKIHVRGELGGKDHKEKEKKSQGKASKYPRLSRFLYSLLEDAGFNQLSLDQVDVRDTYHKLRQAAKKYKLEKNIEASELFFTYPDIEQIQGKLKASLPKWVDIIISEYF
jgi:hypothetical protein